MCGRKREHAWQLASDAGAAATGGQVSNKLDLLGAQCKISLFQPQFRDNNSQREKRRGQWGGFAPCSAFAFVMYSVAMKMGIKLFSPIDLGGLWLWLVFSLVLN